MLILHNVKKTVTVAQRYLAVLSGIRMIIPADEKVAVFSSSSRDRRVLLDLLGGKTLPTAGSYRRSVSVSFPIGDLATASPLLSLRKNVAHVARMYSINPEQMIAFVESSMQAGESFDKPLALLSPPLRRAFAQLVGLAIPFDCYVMLSEPFWTRDPTLAPLRDRCHALFETRAKSSGVIMATNALGRARLYCERSLMLHAGTLTWHDTVEDGWEHLQRVGLQKSTESAEEEEEGFTDIS